MKILKPKYVKAANAWVVTTFNPKQAQNWFSSLAEAEAFCKEGK